MVDLGQKGEHSSSPFSFCIPMKMGISFLNIYFSFYSVIPAFTLTTLSVTRKNDRIKRYSGKLEPFWIKS
jgi:hypothetical protein